MKGDGTRRCALPGCAATITDIPGRPERRYCCGPHRAAARRARRRATRSDPPPAWPDRRTGPAAPPPGPAVAEADAGAAVVGIHDRPGPAGGAAARYGPATSSGPAAGPAAGAVGDDPTIRVSVAQWAPHPVRRTSGPPDARLDGATVRIPFPIGPVPTGPHRAAAPAEPAPSRGPADGQGRARTPARRPTPYRRADPGRPDGAQATVGGRSRTPDPVSGAGPPRRPPARGGPPADGGSVAVHADGSYTAVRPDGEGAWRSVTVARHGPVIVVSPGPRAAPT